jgi:hypothetical protein
VIAPTSNARLQTANTDVGTMAHPHRTGSRIRRLHCTATHEDWCAAGVIADEWLCSHRLFAQVGVIPRNKHIVRQSLQLKKVVRSCAHKRVERLRLCARGYTSCTCVDIMSRTTWVGRAPSHLLDYHRVHYIVSVCINIQVCSYSVTLPIV